MMVHIVMSKQGLENCLACFDAKTGDQIILLDPAICSNCRIESVQQSVLCKDGTVSPEVLAKMLINARGKSVTWY